VADILVVFSDPVGKFENSTLSQGRLWNFHPWSDINCLDDCGTSPDGKSK